MALLGDNDLVVRWWKSPNRGFDMQCPCDVDETSVQKYLEFFCYK
jgi:hypothetical protein